MMTQYPASDTPEMRPTRTSLPTNTLEVTGRPQPSIPAATLQAEATLHVLEQLCGEFDTDSSVSAALSPAGEWAAITCGYKRNQALIVTNQEDKEWVIRFSDLVNPKYEGISGSLYPIAWDPNTDFMYFTKSLGFSGGGTQCFPGFGSYGLYKLDLETGTYETIIATDDENFPGNEIRFSPSNEYYAVDRRGLTIGNIVTGEVLEFDVANVIGMRWSPDARYLAFSVARCGEHFVESSSIYVWDESTGEIELLYSSTDKLLEPDFWIENSILQFTGETQVDLDSRYTIFQYDLMNKELASSATATPRP